MKLLTSARALLLVTLAFSLAICSAAQDHAMSAMKPVAIMTGLGNLHHPVSTKSSGSTRILRSRTPPDLRLQPR